MVKNKPIIFMFSGQGSHYYQMGKVLFEQNAIFNQWMKQADAICKEIINLSVIEQLYQPQHKKGDNFSNTLLTNPAIFMVEHALGQVLLNNNIIPDRVLGSSLGEYAAGVFAGLWTFETALQTVIHQAQLLETNCAKGGMLAILSSPKLYDDNKILHEHSEIAAVNFNSHFVVAGKPEGLKMIESFLTARQISFQALAVSQAFHSTFVDPAKLPYLDFLQQQSLSSVTMPFISCLNTQYHLSPIPHEHFWDVLRKPIQFQDTIKALEKEGSYYYVDVGPAGTLATFVKYNLTGEHESRTLALMSPFINDMKNIENLHCFLNQE